MKREEFLNTLFENIPDYTKEEQEEIRQYYEELICDGVEAGLDEEEVISRLESPENIAFSLKKEYKEERKAEVSVVCDSSDDYTSSQPVAHAVISARDRGIALEPSEDGRVHVHCEKDEIDEIVCYEKEGMFFFSHRSKRRMHFFGGFSRVDSTKSRYRNPLCRQNYLRQMVVSVFQKYQSRRWSKHIRQMVELPVMM